MRNFIFWVHFGSGLLAGGIIFLMALTGVILAFEPQISAGLEAPIRKVKAGAARPVMYESILRAQQSVEGPSLSGVTLWADPNRSIQIQFGREETRWVDPYTGAVLASGVTDTQKFFSFVTSLHRWLGVSGTWRGTARSVTGWCNLAFLFLALSGLYLWWPRRWSLVYLRAVTWFKAGLKGKARQFNWHNVIGFWLSPFLILISLTGVLISFPWASNLLFQVTGSPVPKGREAGPRQEGRGRSGPDEVSGLESAGFIFPLDKALQTLSQQAPGWEKIQFRLEPGSQKEVNATVYAHDSARPNDRTRYALDPLTATVRKSEPYSAMNPGQKLRSWVRSLHTGEAGGVFGQFLMGLASLGTLVLVWSGFVLAWYRLFARKRQKQESVVLPESGEPVAG